MDNAPLTFTNDRNITADDSHCTAVVKRIDCLARPCSYVLKYTAIDFLDEMIA